MQKQPKNYKVTSIGLELIKLIEDIQVDFEKEYGFKLDGVKITNLIAKRYREAGLVQH